MADQRWAYPRADGTPPPVLAVAAGHDVDLVPVAGPADAGGQQPAVFVSLDDDPRHLSTWAPAVASGVPVVVRRVPSPGSAVREARALGVLAEVPAADAGAVAAAAAALADVPDDDRRLAARAAARRLAGGHLDSAPRVLFVATTARDVTSARSGVHLVSSFGGQSFVVVTRHALRGDEVPLPDTTTLTVVDDPTTTSVLARAERAALLRVPPLAVAVLNRASGRVPALGPAAALLERTAGALDRVGHRRMWMPAAVRLRPWLLARRALVDGARRWDDAGVDLVVAPGADAQALVWELLRHSPDLESRGTLNQTALGTVVRRRVRRALGVPVAAD